jgi:hypothetical protein
MANVFFFKVTDPYTRESRYVKQTAPTALSAKIIVGNRNIGDVVHQLFREEYLAATRKKKGK